MALDLIMISTLTLTDPYETAAFQNIVKRDTLTLREKKFKSFPKINSHLKSLGGKVNHDVVA